MYNAWPHFSQVYVPLLFRLCTILTTHSLIVIFLTRFMLDLRGMVFHERSVAHTTTLLSRVSFVSFTGNLGVDLETFAGVYLDDQSGVQKPDFLDDDVESGEEQDGLGQNNETFNLQPKVGRYTEEVSY